MAEVKLILCGPDVMGWATYVYANERNEKVEIVVWGKPSGDEIWLYPTPYGPGRECAGLLSAQIEAIEILSHD